MPPLENLVGASSYRDNTRSPLRRPGLTASFTLAEREAAEHYMPLTRETEPCCGRRRSRTAIPAPRQSSQALYLFPMLARRPTPSLRRPANSYGTTRSQAKAVAVVRRWFI